MEFGGGFVCSEQPRLRFLVYILGYAKVTPPGCNLLNLQIRQLCYSATTYQKQSKIGTLSKNTTFLYSLVNQMNR